MNSLILPFVMPATQLAEFERLWKMKMYEGRRWGQALYDYLNLHKMRRDEDSDEKRALDKLYYADYRTARAMIDTIVDNDH